MKKLLAGLLVAGMLSITTSPVFAYAGINDVSKDYWAQTEIAAVVKDSVMFLNNGKFNPEAKISRVDFVTALLIGLTVLSKFVKLPFKVPKLTGWSMPKLSLPKLKMPKIKLPKVKMPKFSNIVSGLKNFGKKVLNYIKKPVSFIASKIKRLHI